MTEGSGHVSFQPAVEFEPTPVEIGQDALKTQLNSCISDLEKDRCSLALDHPNRLYRDFVDFNKENQPINLSSPPQAFSPAPTFSPAPKQVRTDFVLC